jgi:hypothetical protein
VFAAPLAHATVSLTALMPRRRAVTPEVWRVHVDCEDQKDRKNMKEMKVFFIS